MSAVAPEVMEPVGLVEEQEPAEPVAEAVAEVSEQPAQEAGAESGGPTRDEKGRFAPKTETPATEPVEGEAPAAEEAAEAAAIEPVAAAPDVFASATPWSMKVDGQNVVLDGAVILPGKGVLFPEQHMGIVRQMIARGIQYEQERPRVREQLRQEREAVAAEKAQLSAVGQVVERLLNAKDEDELATLTFDLWSNRDGLKREAEYRRREAELKARESALAPTPEQQQLDIESRLGESLSDGFAQAKRAPWGAKLQDSDWQALQNVIEPVRRSFIVRVPEDVPEAGLKQGDLAFNSDLFFQFVERQAGLLTTERARILGEKKKAAVNAQAAARNTAALRPSVQAPPGVASAEKPAPTPGSGSVFTSREEFERWVQKGG